MKKMKKIILLAADRKPALACLEVLANSEKKGIVELEAVVSEISFVEKISKIFKKQIVFFEDSKRNEDRIYKTIKKSAIDLLISIQYKWIISEEIINAVNGFAFNIHFGKLPEYRGHHTHIHAILNGEKNITTTLHWMAGKVDRGYIAFEKLSPIKDKDTSWSLMQKATIDSVMLFKKLMMCISKNMQIPKIPIDDGGHFYRKNSIFKLKQIVSMENFSEVSKKTKAFYFPPHEPAYFMLNKQKFYVIPKLSYYNNDSS